MGIKGFNEFGTGSPREEAALYHFEEEEDVVARDVGLEGHLVSLFVEGVAFLLINVSELRDISEHPKYLAIKALINICMKDIFGGEGGADEAEGKEVPH